MPMEKQSALCQRLGASKGQRLVVVVAFLGDPAEPCNSLQESSALNPTPGAMAGLGCCSPGISIRVCSKGFQISE